MENYDDNVTKNNFFPKLSIIALFGFEKCLFRTPQKIPNLVNWFQDFQSKIKEQQRCKYNIQTK